VTKLFINYVGINQLQPETFLRPTMKVKLTKLKYSFQYVANMIVRLTSFASCDKLMPQSTIVCTSR